MSLGSDGEDADLGISPEGLAFEGGGRQPGAGACGSAVTMTKVEREVGAAAGLGGEDGVHKDGARATARMG